MSDRLADLEDVTKASTKQFYESHNMSTDAYFEGNEYLEFFADKISEIGEVDVRGLPVIKGSKTFYIERRKDWQKPKLQMQDGKETVTILDFEDNELALDFWYPSPSGAYVLYGTSTGGNEQSTIRIIDTSSVYVLDDSIEFAGFTDQGNICWLDEKQFIYPRMNGFDKTGPEDKWLLGSKLYLHKLGDDPRDDKLVFGKDLPDTVMLNPTLSHSRQHLYVTVCEDELTHSVYQVRLDTLEARPLVIADKSACYIKTAPGVVYILTNLQTENYRLLACEERNFEYDLDAWDEILPEEDDVLQDFWFLGPKHLMAQYSHKVSSRLRVYDRYGNQEATVSLPKHSIVYGVSARHDSTAAYFSAAGFTHPTTIYSYSVEKDALGVVWQRARAEGDDQIVHEQLWAVSEDGTKVPYFWVHKKDVTEDSLTILYGYGGFNISLEPSYLGAVRPWVLAGGSYILMNLRGGSEFGENWHRSGSLKNKQNTFNDCFAIAEDVIRRNISSAEKIGVMGGSNGGLLVAAVTVQRPELFRAGVSLVPLTDMYEFYKHQVAEFWVHEYGDPREPEEREWISKWSPLHYPIDASKTYPALYYETALGDARVHPFHAFKMVSRLGAEVTKTKGPLVLRTMTDTGHQSSNLTKRELARRTAEYYAFFAQELGLKAV